MTRFPLVSVVIVNYNNKALLENCLNSVFRSDYLSFEVILVDNASTDGSQEFAESNFENQNIKIIKNRTNVGFARGNNLGIAQAQGECIVFLNNDTEVDKNWLKELIFVLESEPAVGAVQCKLLMMQQKNKFDSAGGYVDRFIIPTVRGAGEYDFGQYDKVSEIFWAKGAAFAVKRDVLSAVGTFDEDYFLEYEETDLCWRIWLKGYRILFAPKSIVFHAGSASISQRKLKAFYFFHRNHISTMLKNYELLNIFRYLPPLLLIKIITDVRVAREEHFIRLKAIWFNLANLQSIWQKRQLMEANGIRGVSDKDLFKRNIFVSFNEVSQNLEKR